MRHYEHQGKDQGLDALAYNARLDMFMKDWQRWKVEGGGSWGWPPGRRLSS